MSLVDIAKNIIDSTPKRSTTGLISNGGINFSSNNYLGLAFNKSVVKAVASGLREHGVGSSGSRLMAGDLKIYLHTEEALAEFFGYEACLLFGSGYLTNYGVLTSLVGSGCTIFLDKNCHASIIDGVRMAEFNGARWRTFKHNNLQDLEVLLQSTTGYKFIITEGVFSMDGHVPPMVELQDLANKYNAIFIVDESHSIGVFGSGKGICCQLGVKPDIITAGFGKAFGLYGGACLCSSTVRKALQQRARSFIFSTAFPPSLCYGLLQVVKILQAKPKLGIGIIKKSLYLRKLLGLVKESFLGSLAQPGDCLIYSNIVQVILGSPERALLVAEALQEKDFLIKAILHPTVPKGEECIRISVCSWHSYKQLNSLAEYINSLKETEIEQ